MPKPLGGNTAAYRVLCIYLFEANLLYSSSQVLFREWLSSVQLTCPGSLSLKEAE